MIRVCLGCVPRMRRHAADPMRFFNLALSTLPTQPHEFHVSVHVEGVLRGNGRPVGPSSATWRGEEPSARFHRRQIERIEAGGEIWANQRPSASLQPAINRRVPAGMMASKTARPHQRRTQARSGTQHAKLVRHLSGELVMEPFNFSQSHTLSEPSAGDQKREEESDRSA